MTEWSDKTAPVQILVNGVTTTLTPSQELIAAGTVQVAPNAEKTPAVTQTRHIIPAKAP